MKMKRAMAAAHKMLKTAQEEDENIEMGKVCDWDTPENDYLNMNFA